MLTLEEAFNTAIIEEGQFLFGEEFIVDTLGFTWDKLHKLFIKSVKEFSRRRPVVETKVIKSSSEAGIYQMPEGTIAVTAIRYDILNAFPRYMFPDFGQLNFEFEKHNRILKTFPPMQTLRVTYSREYTFSNSAPITMTDDVASYDKELIYTLSAFPKKGSIKITKEDASMGEVGRVIQEIDNGTPQHKKVELIELKGSLGKGLYNPETRELAIYPKIKSDGEIIISFMPKYKYVNELSLTDTLYLNLFKSYLLEAIASIRNQATQSHLHNIDLTSDDLYNRARFLRSLVIKNLRETFDFGATALI